MSLPEPGVIWRLIAALNRPADQPIGPIHLTSADADWLCDHLLSIAAPPPRRGRKSRNDHFVWAALDVALRLPASQYSLKAAWDAVAVDWKTTDDKIEHWESEARDAARDLLKTGNSRVLERMVKHHRDAYLKKST